MIRIYKSRPVKSPTRGTEQSAGLDFYVPEDYNSAPVLKPGEHVNIPSGVHVLLPAGTVLVFFNKSGVALKKRLQIGACVIDEDYQGEVHLHVTNIGRKSVVIKRGEKLAQALLLQVSYPKLVEETSLEDLYQHTSTRGTGAFGSTGDF